ncbi:Aste57867_2472 [Aphanomyces stellatus]|uniref:Aste57867_2472 protein n=1 Tax=Aphanomyces stellatus TaxID=120398 RepID=A0A485KBC5_9STRA|nr:hypothetical protein As57867_002466 [Aphanomyces stellatus]VFT79671.1 Aste57867_2472 [Aphanomyces stellatus]
MLDRDVVEAASDGSFDVDEIAALNASWEELKAEGNACFQKKDYIEALKKYSAAMADAPPERVHLLHGNRATCYFQMKEYRVALDEVNAALVLVPTWDKGLSRKQCILAAIAKKKAAAPPPTLYDDKAPVLPDNDAAKASHLLWRRFKAGLDNANQDCLDGVFARLQTESDFRQLLYPGLTAEDIAKQGLPRTLKQLLEDPWYETEMLELMPKVQAKAQSVLENVKRKGAAMGDHMDATTEAMLRPQVLREAFGREVLAMLQRVAVQKHAMLAQDARRIADPDADCATWDSLPSRATLDAVLVGPGFGTADAFLGADFVPLVQSDVRRMHKQKQLLAADGCFLRFFVDTDDGNASTEQFPALAELLEKLRALPHEINRKRGSQLCAVSATCVVCLEPGQSQPLRLDCGTDAAHDNGYKLTCIYCVGSGDDDDDGGRVDLRPMEDQEPCTSVQAKADRLVLFRSQHVLNAIPAVPNATMYYVVCRIQGLRL